MIKVEESNICFKGDLSTLLAELYCLSKDLTREIAKELGHKAAEELVLQSVNDGIACSKGDKDELKKRLQKMIDKL